MVLFLVVVVGGILLVRQVISTPLFDDNPKRTLAEMEQILGARLPSDAVDIIYDGERGYAAYITLSFKASSEATLEFAKHICDGVLHQGYDPYNALNTSQKPDQKPYLIQYDNFNFSYYSYSPNTPDTVWGNRCWPFRTGLYQIRIDHTNPTLSELRFDQLNQHSPLWGEDRKCNLIPCSSIGDNFIRPAREDLPLIIIGMTSKDDSSYGVVTDEVCLEFQMDYVLGFGWSQVEKWKYLIGATVDVMVDDVSQGLAYISENELLTRIGNEPYHPNYDYCFTQNWTPGIHTLWMTIKPHTQVSKTYTWEFIAQSYSLD